MVINGIIILLALLSCAIVWNIYMLTRARSVLLILCAVIWATVFRGVVSMTEVSVSQWMLGFWVMFPAGMYALLRTIKKFIK